MIGLAERLGWLNDALLWICRYGVIVIVAALALILSCAVFWRYALNNAIPWSEEGAKYLMVWLAFLGAPIALRHGGHINVDLLGNLLSGRARQAHFLLINLIVVAVMLVLLWQGYAFAKLGARQVASSFQMSMLWVYVVVPVGAGLMLLVSLENALRACAGIANPANGLIEDHAAYVDEIRE